MGDLFDETGIYGSNSLECDEGTEYVLRVRALPAAGWGGSGFSADVSATTLLPDANNCTFTQGYWKSHEEEWPVTSLTLGTVTYPQAQLLAILNRPAQGNGLVFLAHQLIAAKLNVARGASVPASVAQAIADADALIGGLVVPPVGSGYIAPNQASGLTQTLDQYNNGTVGPGHCESTAVETGTWGSVKGLFR